MNTLLRSGRSRVDLFDRPIMTRNMTPSALAVAAALIAWNRRPIRLNANSHVFHSARAGRLFCGRDRSPSVNAPAQRTTRVDRFPTPRKYSMNRRETVLGLAAAVAIPHAACAQQGTKIPLIGFLSPGFSGGVPGPDSAMTGLLSGLSSLGYTDGRTIKIETRWAEGKPELLPSPA